MPDAPESGDTSMHIDAQRAKQLADNLSHVLQRVQSASSSSGGRNVSVIAVSKLKPANDILALHGSAHAQRDFGENYAQELTDKAALLPRDIRWHMIGGLQTNKCRPLAEQVANLYCVSSVDTAKKADALEKGRAALAGRESGDVPPLKILVQVNTSGEENKSGVEPAEAAELCRHVRHECPHLELAGLMTIGAIARSHESSTPDSVNEDFVSLKDTRDRVAHELGIDAGTLRLSMGMSSDFEAAISQGSDEVRVGTTIFGDRPPKKDAKVKNDVASNETT